MEAETGGAEMMGKIITRTVDEQIKVSEAGNNCIAYEHLRQLRHGREHNHISLWNPREARDIMKFIEKHLARYERDGGNYEGVHAPL